MSKIVAGSSKIQGRGIFATQDIRKGETAFIMKGKIMKCNIVTKHDAMKLPDIVGVGKCKWIDPIPPFKYINHSCEPNLGMKGTVTFVALRNIKKGEEVTFDYSISEDSLWEMKCYCGSSKCRKVIKGIRYLPLQTFKSYLPYIPPYFQRIYRNHKREEKKNGINLLGKKQDLENVFSVFKKVLAD